ncbi:alpha/beta hydrolase [Nocardia sp. NPDC050412]|uniref:alpha/beta hydrolase n=1 Tax=Nocardia sp. NPDC050412 TaxID=3364320 RepID=UPI00379A9DFE
MYEEVTFALPDVELRGRLYRPEGDGPHPVVIFHSGVGSVAEGNYPYADLFTERGLAVVFYDHRGLGYSGGTLRQELDPVQNARDLRDVITLLSERDDIDEQQISLSGFSLGGTISLIAAGFDHRVASVASAVGPVSSAAAFGLFPPEALPAVQAAVDESRREQLHGGQGTILQTAGVPVPDGPQVAFADPLGWEFTQQFLHLPSFRNEITTTSLGRLWEMELMPLAPRLTARLLMIVGTEDTLSRTEDIREFFEQVQTEKLFEEYPGSHYEILLGEGYRKLIARTADFIAENAADSASR